MLLRRSGLLKDHLIMSIESPLQRGIKFDGT